MDKVTLYRGIIWPLISRFATPNTAHERMIGLAAWLQAHPRWLRLVERMVTEGGRRFESERLRANVGGVGLDNPLILAAGFDKDGRCSDTLYRIGFGAVVVGTVLEHSQPGNPLPTLFRPAPDVILNRMGFPSAGMERVRQTLNRRRERAAPVGISIGLNRDRLPVAEVPEAYAAVARTLYDHAAFFEINVSSPNTPGLRRLQDREYLIDIVRAVNTAMDSAGARKPLLVKIAPDLTLDAVDEVVRVALDEGASGIVATNTTTDPAIKAALGPRWADEAGGVSGHPLRARSTELVRHIFRCAGDRLAVIGSGGVDDLESALAKFRAGASAIQLYSGLIYHGPALPTTLNRALDGWMAREGIGHISEIVGA